MPKETIYTLIFLIFLPLAAIIFCVIVNKKVKKGKSNTYHIENDSVAFTRAVRELTELINNCPQINLDPKQIKFECICYLYFISDTVAFTANKDRYKLKEEILAPYVSQMDFRKFDQRQQLYTDALYDNVFIRGYIAPGVQPESNDIVTKSILLFTDFLLHPACADNYIDEPLLLLGIDFTLRFHIDIHPQIVNITKELGMKIKGN